MSTETFTHLDEHGRAHMVDVTAKVETKRRAVARCVVTSRLNLAHAISHDDLVAIQLAGEQVVKRTSNFIPLCHPLPIDDVRVRISVYGSRCDIEADVSATAKTGVEMEALSAVTAAALSLFFVIDERDPTAEISDIEVVSKEGGKSGPWGRAVQMPT